jgi:O-antigen ligase
MKTILNILLFATITTLPFAGVHFFVLGVPLYMPELLLIFASACFVWVKCHTDTFKIHSIPQSILWSITALVIGLISSSIFNHITTLQLGIIKSWFFFPMLFAWLLFQTLHQVSSQEQVVSVNLHQTLLVWYATLVSVSLVALSYFFSGNLTYDGRLKAFYLSPNYLALFLFPGVLLGFYFFKQFLSQQKYFYTSLAFLSWLLVCTVLYLTLSYTVIIASVFGFCITLFFILKSKFLQRTTILMICIIFLSLFILTQSHNQKFFDITHLTQRSSLASRIMIWQSSWRMIGNHPLIGIGPGNFQPTYLDYQKYFPPYLEWAVPHPHNLYLSFWLQTGIVGFVGFLALISFWVQILLEAINIDTKKAPLLWTLLGIILTLLCIGLFDTPYWKNDLAYEFWILLSTSLFLSSKRKK